MSIQYKYRYVGLVIMNIAAMKPRRGRPTGEGDQGASTRAAILDAAERRFADEGFASARLQDIAEDAGKTAPAVAHFFKDKASLHAAVIARLANDFAVSVAASVAAIEAGGITRVMAWIQSWIHFMRQRPALLGFILRDMADGRLHPLSQSSWTHASAQFAHLLKEAASEDGTAPSDDTVINITSGPTVFFMVGAARLSDEAFEPALSVHLETVRKALAAILTHPDE